jgi:excisionase family DNA binding protein
MLDDLPDLVEVPEVAKRLHKSESTIRRMCARGDLAAVKIGRSWLIPVAEVRRLLAPVMLAGGRKMDAEAVREAAEQNEQPAPKREAPRAEGLRGDPASGSGERSARAGGLQARIIG